MSTSPDIARGVDQAVALVDGLTPDQLDLPTPCERWSVRDLTDHLVNSTQQMAVMAQGGEPDWTALDVHHDDPATALSEAGAALVTALAADGCPAPPGMIASEIAVHTWDLATALGRGTGELDQELADVGHSFMTQALTDDRRGDSFGPEQDAPEGADSYQRIAAFAGRTV